LIKVLKVILVVITVFAITACGGPKKIEPPEYFFAKQGKPLAAVAPKGIKIPDLSGALVIPRVNQPLGEYDPKLIDPPNVIGELADKVDEELKKDEEK
jgi:uncharacterized lipoprotein